MSVNKAIRYGQRYRHNGPVGRGPAMSEPLFFDCLTERQIWSLFDSGVLHDYRLPVEVYERLERIAPEHGCYLFTWLPGRALPDLQGLLPGMGLAREGSSEPTPGHDLEAPISTEFMHAAMQAMCAHAPDHRKTAGGRIYLLTTLPYPSLRPGPYLALQARDLEAMSMSELEAYLADVLRLDDASIGCEQAQGMVEASVETNDLGRD